MQAAIKVMPITAKNFKYILPEIINHKTLNHPNVVGFQEAFFVPSDKQLWVNIYLSISLSLSPSISIDMQ